MPPSSAEGSITEARRVFHKHSFEEVEKLAKDGQVDKQTSETLAEGRRQMISEAMKETLRRVDPDGKLVKRHYR